MPPSSTRDVACNFKIVLMPSKVMSKRLRWSGGRMLVSDTHVRGFDPGRRKIVSMPSFGGEVKPSVPCRRFATCKRSLQMRGICHFSAKLLAISRPQFPLSLLGVSRVVVDVGAPGGASGNFQSRASTISLYGCGTSSGPPGPNRRRRRRSCLN
jgi:hypothetical protein